MKRLLRGCRDSSPDLGLKRFHVDFTGFDQLPGNSSGGSRTGDNPAPMRFLDFWIRGSHSIRAHYCWQGAWQVTRKINLVAILMACEARIGPTPKNATSVSLVHCSIQRDRIDWAHPHLC
jgi:hypothetical protein